VADDQPTQQQPADGEPPRDPRPSGETSPFPRPEKPDETSVMPPVEEPARWSARAGVPVGGPRQAVPEPQWVPEQQPRTWWAPVLIVLALLVLLGLIALGLWLAMRGQSGPAPSPSAVPSSVASSPSPTPSLSPSPTGSPSSTTVMVPVPSLRGIAVSDAEQILQSQGLNWKVVTRVSDAFPAGTVIETDPAATTPVPAGTEVTLFVATPPPTSPSPTSSD